MPQEIGPTTDFARPTPIAPYRLPTPHYSSPTRTAIPRNLAGDGTGFAPVQGWVDAVDASDLPAIPLFKVSVHMSMGPGGLFGGGSGWYQPQGPYGAYPGCGCSGILMIMAGILLVLAGLMRGCNM